LVGAFEDLATAVSDRPAAASAAERALAEARRFADATGDPAGLEAAYLALVTAIAASAAASPVVTPATPATSTAPESAVSDDEVLMRDFLVRAHEHCDDAEAQLLALEADPSDRTAIDAVFRAFHTVKGMSGFLGFAGVSDHAHESESLLAEARSGASALDTATVSALFAAVDALRSLCASAAGAAPQADGDPVAARTAVSAPTASTSVGTVRVDEARLDALLDLIGELVIAESTVSGAVRQREAHELVEGRLDGLDKITRELQQLATSMRMVSLRPTFLRMRRLVRDLADKAGKQVALTVFGEDAELDKAVVDRIQDPLVHALRNAVDHGIESPDEREAAGKPRVGTIVLSASHVGGAVHIEVADDGRGIDAAAVARRAVTAGLASDESQVSHEDAERFVFAPGLSTASEVTDVSGRGVGMDAVRRAVESLRGRVELRSRPGDGTSVVIRLPVTLAIIDGMVVRVGEERYVFPMPSIERCVRPAPEAIASVPQGDLLLTDDGPVPLVRLDRLFDTPGAVQDPTRGVVIITRDGESRTGFVACELLGQQQTVIKPLGDGLVSAEGMAGGAIMPDGRVGIIVDAVGLSAAAQDRKGERS
ncbi:MAG: chemotaxis protein CheA, partial [Actinobacteria bacterium]